MTIVPEYNMHGKIVVNADRSDWGKKWGWAEWDDCRCWCYECTVRRIALMTQEQIQAHHDRVQAIWDTKVSERKAPDSAEEPK